MNITSIFIVCGVTGIIGLALSMFLDETNIFSYLSIQGFILRILGVLLIAVPIIFLLIAVTLFCINSLGNIL